MKSNCSQIHKSMSRYHYKDIKMLVAFFPTVKMFLSVEIKTAAARSCSLKTVLSEVLKNSQEITPAGISVLKNKIKEK